MAGDRNILELPREEVEDRDHKLISSRRVEGTAVYGTDGRKIGTVHSVMLDKRSGQAVYAVVSFGGFLHTHDLVHPLPWRMLDYDPERGGYVVSLSKEQLDEAPVYRLDEADRPRESSQEEIISAFWMHF